MDRRLEMLESRLTSFKVKQQCYQGMREEAMNCEHEKIRQHRDQQWCIGLDDADPLKKIYEMKYNPKIFHHDSVLMSEPYFKEPTNKETLQFADLHVKDPLGLDERPGHLAEMHRKKSARLLARAEKSRIMTGKSKQAHTDRVQVKKKALENFSRAQSQYFEGQGSQLKSDLYSASLLSGCREGHERSHFENPDWVENFNRKNGSYRRRKLQENINDDSRPFDDYLSKLEFGDLNNLIREKIGYSLPRSGLGGSGKGSVGDDTTFMTGIRDGSAEKKAWSQHHIEWSKFFCPGKIIEDPVGSHGRVVKGPVAKDSPRKNFCSLIDQISSSSCKKKRAGTKWSRSVDRVKSGEALGPLDKMKLKYSSSINL